MFLKQHLSALRAQMQAQILMIDTMIQELDLMEQTCEHTNVEDMGTMGDAPGMKRVCLDCGKRIGGD